MKNLKNRETKLWIVLSLLVLIAWGITVEILYDSQKSREETLLETELELFEGEINSTLITYEEFSNYIFDRIKDDEEIISIIHKANTASNGEKRLLRDRLYSKLSENYSLMKKYKFRQLHFHLPNTESFLRVHLPERYGDILLENRESVRLVSENKTRISGFEEGKIFNGFRNVYPLEYENEYIGSVEISMSSASIIEILSRLYEKSDFYFIIDKNVVEENLFEDQMGNYRESDLFEDYYVDIEVDEITSKNNLIQGDLEVNLFENIKAQYGEEIKNKQGFSAISKIEGEYYKVRFLSIENFKKTPSAYIISISKSNEDIPFINNMYKEIILVTLLALSIIVFGFIVSDYHYRLRNNAELDSLTEIYNRNKFYDIASREINRAKRFKEDMSIIVMDIDYFKKINDKYGHDWGDEVLKKLTSEISKNIREIDIFARWGGEEFVLLLPNTSKEKGVLVGEKIRELIEISNSKELKDITISVGVSEIDSENYDIKAAINLADQAMYEAKRKGRNQVCSK